MTLALPAGFALPAGLAQFDAVRVHVAVGTDGKLTLLSIGDDRNNRDDDRADDDEDEVEVTGKITALSDSVDHRHTRLVRAGDMCVEQAADRASRSAISSKSSAPREPLEP